MADIDNIDKIIQEISPHYKKAEGPDVAYRLVYDSTTETLEPFYFWLLDYLNKIFGGGNVRKIADNFASSPGSGHFSELQGKASHMQQEASRVLGTVNSILKGVLNLIYDLKEFKIRLSHYDEAKSENKEKKEAGLLALKQIWMDKVDIQRGQGSINAMTAGNLQFVTLRDAFMIVKSVKDVDKVDLNERVKRVLKPRVQEFFEWKKRSETELRKRFEVEKIYLKSQVDALRLNTQWARPYLRASQQLTQSEKLSSRAELVTAFNTVLLQLTLMATVKVDVEHEAFAKNIPEGLGKMKRIRPYYSVVVLDFIFRGIPGKSGQHYVFGGRAEVDFRAYGLNEDEMNLLDSRLLDSDLEDSLRLVQGMTEDSLGTLKLDIEEFLGSEDEKPKPRGENPFTALAGFFQKRKKDEGKKKAERLKMLKAKGVPRPSYPEKYVRNLAAAEAMKKCFNVYDIYKKNHNMAAFPYRQDEEPSAPQSTMDKLFAFK